MEEPQMSCVVPDCSSTDPDRNFFTFPKNKVMRRLWLEACSLQDCAESDRVCSDHFTLADFR